MISSSMSSPVLLLLFIFVIGTSTITVASVNAQSSTTIIPTTTTEDPSSSSSSPQTTPTTQFPFPIPGEPNTTVFDLNAAATNRVPPFNYTGYFIDRNAKFSTALRGLCSWTTSDSLCVGTVIPILLITLAMLILLVYNCVITPQKEALMNAAAVRDSPLWPASMQSLTDEEVQEVVTSSSGLALKDLFPLLGLESLVQRAAALGLATLKDLLCANALAVRDIGIEVREQRIMARSLERIATHAKKLVAERQKTKKSTANEKAARGRGPSFFGAAARASMLSTAFGGNNKDGSGGDTSGAVGAATTTNIVLNDVMNSDKQQTNTNNRSTDVLRTSNTTSIFQSPLAAKSSQKFSANTNDSKNNISAVASPTSTTTTNTSAGSPPAAFGSPTTETPTTTSSSSAVGKEKWRKLKGRIAAYSLMEKLSGGGRRNEDDDDDDDDDHTTQRTPSPRQQEVNNQTKKQGGKKMEFMDI